MRKFFNHNSFKVLALGELVKLGQCDKMEKMLEAAETLEKSKTGTAPVLQAGLVMAEVLFPTFHFLMSTKFTSFLCQGYILHF